MLSKLGAGKPVTALKNQIDTLRKEIANLERPKKMPELIESANLVRINEYLEKSDSLKTDLLDLYRQYTESLENLLSTVFDIQNELKDIIKEEAKSLSTKRKGTATKRRKATTKPTKATKKRFQKKTIKSSKKSSKRTKRKK